MWRPSDGHRRDASTRATLRGITDGPGAWAARAAWPIARIVSGSASWARKKRSRARSWLACKPARRGQRAEQPGHLRQQADLLAEPADLAGLEHRRDQRSRRGARPPAGRRRARPRARRGRPGRPPARPRRTRRRRRATTADDRPSPWPAPKSPGHGEAVRRGDSDAGRHAQGVLGHGGRLYVAAPDPARSTGHEPLPRTTEHRRMRQIRPLRLIGPTRTMTCVTRRPPRRCHPREAPNGPL